MPKTLKLSKPETYYKAFIERYLDYLNSYQTPTIPFAIERFTIYINNYATLYNYTGPYMQYITTNSKNIDFPFLLELIKNTLVAKQHIINNPSLYKFNLLFTHGGSMFEYFKVPDNLIICLITPVNRYGLIDIVDFNMILEELKNPVSHKKFLDNPSCCYSDNKILQHKTIYYSG
jgi:hypothetical protein